MIENYEGLTQYLEQLGMDLEDYSDDYVMTVIMPHLVSRIDRNPELSPEKKAKWKKDLFAPSLLLNRVVQLAAGDDADLGAGVGENVSPETIRDFLILWGHEVAAARANRADEDMGSLSDLLSPELIVYIRLKDTMKKDAAKFPHVAEPVLSMYPDFATWVVDGETLLDYMWSNFTISILREGDVDAWRESNTAYDTFATFFNNMKYLARAGANLRGRPVRALADYTRMLRVLSVDDMGDRVSQPLDEKLIQQALEIFKWFADQGADFDNEYGFIALSNLASSSSAFVQNVTQLVKYGAPLMSVNRVRQNVFFYDLNMPAFDYLVSLPGAKELINAKTDEGFTSIMYADSPEMFDALFAHGADIEAAVSENGTLFHYVVYSLVDSDNAALMNHFLDWIQAQLDAAETPAQLRSALNRLSRQLHIHHKNDDDLNVTEYLSRQLRNSPDDESLQRAFRYAVLLSGEVFRNLPETIHPLMLESLKVREYIEGEYLAGRPHPLSNVLPRDVVNQIVGNIRQQELCAELNDLDRAELVALGKFLGVEDFDDTTFFIEKDVLCRAIAEHLAQGGSRSAPQSPVPKQSGVQELIWAIEAKNLPVLANLLKLGQDPNELDSFQRDGKTAYLRPLNVALAEADGPEGVSVVKILLRGGADPLLGDQRAENAVAHLGTLHHSAETMDQLKALMARYVDFNDPEMIVDWLMGKLYTAINDDDDPLAKTEAVFEQGVNLPAKYYIRGMTPFQWVDDTSLRSKDGDYPRDEIMNLLQTRLR